MDIIIRQLTTKDSTHFPEGIELLNRTQGRDLFPPNYLEERTKDPKSYVIAAFDRSQLIGVSIAQLITNYDYYLPFVSNTNELFKNKKVGSFSTMCTHESYQGKGIGRLMSQKRLEWVKEQKCDVVVGVSWVSGLKHTSNRVFEKIGFSPVRQVDKFYLQQSIDHPFECPGCNVLPCICSAILYKMDL